MEKKSFLRKPDWLKIKLPGGKNFADVFELLKSSKLNTVCQEAKCPNLGECWKNRTATVMILGKNCTRNCRFCNVTSAIPCEVDYDEPRRVAEAAAELGLKHIVITSVTRDDIEDGGASIFSETVKQLRNKIPGCTIEILIPDFKENEKAFEIILQNPPDILNHNLETIERLYPTVRPQAKYNRSLNLIKWFHQKGLKTKSGIMVGLGETNDEILALMDDLLLHGCDIMTIGQYLQPTKEHLQVERYVTPEEFKLFETEGLKKGFRFVESSPLVRSSYHADKHA